MKRMIFLIGLSIGICFNSYSQDSINTPSYALTFGIKENFRVDKFLLDIGVKKIFSKNQQLRVLISPRYSSNNYDNSMDGNPLVQKQKYINYSLGITGNYLWTILSDDNLSMFSGAGLSLSYGRNYNKSTSGGQDYSEQTGPYWGAGIIGILGIEWMVSKHIGVHVENYLSTSYNWSNFERKSISGGIIIPTESRTITNMELFSSVLLGLSIYI